ncbi:MULTISPECIES: hypothetical protein [unclassified Sphingomonas]|uniref:hypothetical protein n=1 Tax=unclassified Sphingomonas TaxID=196159 RepID=UPI002150B1DC|nr:MULTISPECIES: hypothetical protein [unclassified Sphingomonas]MCR5869727.1 hypothetical protein [Sphingomonas sp. J344]UUX98567.1 hypothetical protein LRS08_13565 [Sphingomonas sp. J315]
MRSALIIASLLWFTVAYAQDVQTGSVAEAPANNQEMADIFAADQAARAEPSKIDWEKLSASDKLRRVRTQALVDAGKLNSADDYYHAAYVFQHGDEAEDCLKAHAFAVIAAARGKREASWIAAATLDRYLQRIGQPQIYGTQFRRAPGGKWTQEPYRRDLLSDAIRQASGVPTVAAQEALRADWERRLP